MLEEFKAAAKALALEEDAYFDALARRLGEGIDVAPKEPLFKAPVQKELFEFMCNKACTAAWNDDNGRQPSSHLNVEMTKQQQHLLKPTFRHVLMGFKEGSSCCQGHKEEAEEAER